MGLLFVFAKFCARNSNSSITPQIIDWYTFFVLKSNSKELCSEFEILFQRADNTQELELKCLVSIQTPIPSTKKSLDLKIEFIILFVRWVYKPTENLLMVYLHIPQKHGLQCCYCISEIIVQLLISLTSWFGCYNFKTMLTIP